MEQQTIKMYGAPWCPDCKRSKQFLSEQRVPYEWNDIDQDEEARAYVQRVNDGRRADRHLIQLGVRAEVLPGEPELVVRGHGGQEGPSPARLPGKGRYGVPEGFPGIVAHGERGDDRLLQPHSSAVLDLP